jgi:hypothetical protein
MEAKMSWSVAFAMICLLALAAIVIGVLEGKNKLRVARQVARRKRTGE